MTKRVIDLIWIKHWRNDMKMKTQTISLKINYCTEWGKCTGLPFFFFFIFFFVSWFFFFFNIHISTVENHHHFSLLTKRGQISVTDFSHKKYHLDNPHGIGDSYSAPRYSSNTNNDNNDYLSYRRLYKKICLTFNKNVGHMQNVTSLYIVRFPLIRGRWVGFGNVRMVYSLILCYWPFCPPVTLFK